MYYILKSVLIHTAVG